MTSNLTQDMTSNKSKSFNILTFLDLFENCPNTLSLTNGHYIDLSDFLTYRQEQAVFVLYFTLFHRSEQENVMISGMSFLKMTRCQNQVYLMQFEETYAININKNLVLHPIYI
jgi:hypothetical protein